VNTFHTYENTLSSVSVGAVVYICWRRILKKNMLLFSEKIATICTYTRVYTYIQQRRYKYTYVLSRYCNNICYQVLWRNGFFDRDALSLSLLIKKKRKIREGFSFELDDARRDMQKLIEELERRNSSQGRICL